MVRKVINKTREEKKKFDITVDTKKVFRRKVYNIVMRCFVPPLLKLIKCRVTFILFKSNLLF